MKPNADQVARARTLLASEGGSAGDAEACAAAAGRVHEKLDAHLAPLLGRAGVRALFARSAKLAQIALSPLADAAAAAEDSATLAAHLQSLEPAVALETGAVLFGTFLDLITTFIGDRLTIEVLHNAWPAIKEMSPRETPK